MAVASGQYDDLRQALLERKTERQGEVAGRSRRRLEDDACRTMASEVGDAGESSTATEQADLNNSQIECDVNELRSIDATLARFEEGSYGMCTCCGGDIRAARLRADPAAERCNERGPQVCVHAVDGILCVSVNEPPVMKEWAAAKWPTTSRRSPTAGTSSPCRSACR
jgi:RNA polymerase-binding transcription factor DksA